MKFIKYNKKKESITVRWCFLFPCLYCLHIVYIVYIVLRRSAAQVLLGLEEVEGDVYLLKSDVYLLKSDLFLRLFSIYWRRLFTFFNLWSVSFE